MSIRRAVLVALGGLLACGGARGARTFTGTCTGVVDGDTITVRHGKKTTQIRLHGVDAPEKGQPFAGQARQHTVGLVFGKHVKVEPVGRDRRGRTAARVHFLGKLHRNPRDRSRPHQVVTVYRSLGEALVQAGLAWWDKKEAPDDSKLARLQAGARQARRGLWAGKDPVAPWRWRRGKRSGTAAVRTNIEAVKTPGSFKVSGVIGKVPGGSLRLVSPPRRPPSKDRACKKDADCTFAPRSGCGCPPCGLTWRDAVNRKHAAWLRAEYARESCPPIDCARCAKPVQWRGNTVVCRGGQCTVEHRTGGKPARPQR